MKINCSIAMTLAVISISGCAVFPYGAYTNEPTKTAQPQPTSQTSFVVREQREAKNCAPDKAVNPKKSKDVLVLLALSGGGSRAAYFSALSMLEMQKMELDIGGSKSNVLHEVDVISSVSGGSLAGAYYAISHDPGSECAGYANRPWNDAEVRELMTLDYRKRWIGNWFWPTNFMSFWLSDYDRTDIMAQTLADSLFDKKLTGIDLTLGELNGLRPNLILNATTGSRGDGVGIPFGQIFTFTTEDFARVCSSVEDYSVARAVMATATFPGVFNFMTLRDYDRKNGICNSNTEDKHYLHVFDGGNADNLGLTSLKRVIWESLKNDAKPSLPYKKIIVIQVDAFTNSRGADPGDSDPRSIFDFFVDTNFLDATDSLLEANRERLLAEFVGGNLFPFGGSGETNKACAKFFHGADVGKYCDKPQDHWDDINKEIKEKLTFVHLSFDKVGKTGGCVDKQGNPVSSDGCLQQQLMRIPTDFKLRSKRHHSTGLTDAEAISCAVPTLFSRDDRKSCGGLLPIHSLPLAQKWGAVKQILQDTATVESEH